MSFKEKIKILPEQLRPIARKFETLVKAKATFENNSLFDYSVGPYTYENESILIPFPDAELWITYFSEGNTSGYSCVFEHCNSYFNAETGFNEVDEVLEMLSVFLGRKLGSLGMLDKEI